MQHAFAANPQSAQAKLGGAWGAPPVLQRRSASPSQQAVPPVLHAVPPIVHHVLRSPGRPLDRATRAFMEPRFGHDFSKVRVHADATAAESARAVSALAYAMGDHVAFRTGKYAPGTSAGRHLLAHELAHVVQQARGGSGSDPEARADAAAGRIVRDQSVPPDVVGSAPSGLYRQSSAEEKSEDPWKKALQSSKRSVFGSSVKNPFQIDPSSPLFVPQKPLFFPGSSPSERSPPLNINMFRQDPQHELNPNLTKAGATKSGLMQTIERLGGGHSKLGVDQLDVYDPSGPPKKTGEKIKGVDKFKIEALANVSHSTWFGGIGAKASIDWLWEQLRR